MAVACSYLSKFPICFGELINAAKLPILPPVWLDQPFCSTGSRPFACCVALSQLCNPSIVFRVQVRWVPQSALSCVCSHDFICADLSLPFQRCHSVLKLEASLPPMTLLTSLVLLSETRMMRPTSYRYAFLSCSRCYECWSRVLDTHSNLWTHIATFLSHHIRRPGMLVTCVGHT